MDTFPSCLGVTAVTVLTVHVVTFGVSHVETRSLHVGRQHIPPFVFITQHGLCTCRALSAGWTHTHTHTMTFSSMIKHHV